MRKDSQLKDQGGQKKRRNWTHQGGKKSSQLHKKRGRGNENKQGPEHEDKELLYTEEYERSEKDKNNG